MKIFKYQIEIRELNVIEMPIRAKTLSVQMQRGRLYLWAYVDEHAPTKQRKISVFGTGHDLPFLAHEDYIGTVQTNEGSLVWHVFDGGPV